MVSVRYDHGPPLRRKFLPWHPLVILNPDYFRLPRKKNNHKIEKENKTKKMIKWSYISHKIVVLSNSSLFIDGTCFLVCFDCSWMQILQLGGSGACSLGKFRISEPQKRYFRPLWQTFSYFVGSFSGNICELTWAGFFSMNGHCLLVVLRWWRSIYQKLGVRGHWSPGKN